MVEIYDPGGSLVLHPTSTKRDFSSAVWLQMEFYSAGGGQMKTPLSSIEKFDQLRKSNGLSEGTFLKSKMQRMLQYWNNKVYVVSGKNSNGYSNKVYAADLLPHRDLYFRSVASETVNRGPTAIFALGDLNISENQPSGTIVGEFNATDPDEDEISYFLVSGEGDGGNSFFTLDANGTLKNGYDL